MAIKRVILAHNSGLLREVFHRVIERSECLEVVQEVPHHEDLPLAVQRFCPDWVLVSLPLSDLVQDCISTSLQSDPSVRFIFFSADNQSIEMDPQATSKADLSTLSLKAFLSILETDLQQF
jgi:hypothetical protein